MPPICSLPATNNNWQSLGVYLGMKSNYILAFQQQNFPVPFEWFKPSNLIVSSNPSFISLLVELFNSQINFAMRNVCLIFSLNCLWFNFKQQFIESPTGLLYKSIQLSFLIHFLNHSSPRALWLALFVAVQHKGSITMILDADMLSPCHPHSCATAILSLGQDQKVGMANLLLPCFITILLCCFAVFLDLKLIMQNEKHVLRCL